MAYLERRREDDRTNARIRCLLKLRAFFFPSKLFLYDKDKEEGREKKKGKKKEKRNEKRNINKRRKQKKIQKKQKASR